MGRTTAGSTGNKGNHDVDSRNERQTSVKGPEKSAEKGNSQDEVVSGCQIETVIFGHKYT